jgi:ubiquitin-protein ligase
MRVTIAAQYLTTFANRIHAYRVPSVLGLISFNENILVQAPLSPLVSIFEDGIRRIVPWSRTRLWDTLKQATQELLRFARPDGVAKFPSAELRIVVISDGDDMGSCATPLQALQAMIAAKVVCDSVLVTSADEGRKLCAVSHLTGGLAFRPATIEEGMLLFEKEAFLCYDKRRKPARIRDLITDETIERRAAMDKFDTTVESSTTVAATGKQPIAVPGYVIYQNRNEEIPDPRRRRILRELHQAAAVQQEGCGGRHSDRNDVAEYDPDLRIYAFRAYLDQWRVFVKGVDGTPYADKWWYIYVTFPDEYPAQPPIFRFISIPYHMNVSSDGRICLSAIESGYEPDMTVVELIQTIRQMFLLPDPTTPLDIGKYFEYREQREEYERRAAESTRLHAKNTVEDWLVGLKVETDVPSDDSIEIGEQIPLGAMSAFIGTFIPKEKLVETTLDRAGLLVYDRARVTRWLAPAVDPIPKITGKPLGPAAQDYV